LEGPRNSDLDSAPDFSTTLSSVVSTAHAQASGFRDALTVMAHASSEASGYLFEADNDAYGEAWNSGKFKLTGAGIALITLPYSISVSAGGACSGAVCDYSRAEVYIVGRYDSADGTSSGSATSRKLLENNDPAFSGTFSLAVVNLDGSTVTTGNLFAQAMATALSPVTAVPEPEYYAMFLAGLGIIGLIVRRRSQ